MRAMSYWIHSRVEYLSANCVLKKVVERGGVARLQALLHVQVILFDRVDEVFRKRVAFVEWTLTEL